MTEIGPNNHIFSAFSLRFKEIRENIKKNLRISLQCPKPNIQQFEHSVDNGYLKLHKCIYQIFREKERRQARKREKKTKQQQKKKDLKVLRGHLGVNPRFI